MTSITYTLPKEFNSIRYHAYMPQFLQEFTTVFGEMKKLHIEVEVHRLLEGEQFEITMVEDELGNGTLTVPFIRYLFGQELSKLPEPEEFLPFIRLAIIKASQDYN